MAEEDTDEGEGEAAGPDLAAKAKKKKLFLLIGIVVALLLVSGGGTFALLHFLGNKTPPAATVAAGADAKDSKDGKPAAPEGAPTAKGKALYLALDPFLANFTVSGRQHYLQLSLSVLARDQSALDALHTHMPLVRNRVVMLLSGELFETLQTDEGRIQLQQKLLSAMQEILQKETGNPGIEQVLYQGFVMT